MIDFIVDNAQEALTILGFFCVYVLQWENFSRNFDSDKGYQNQTGVALIYGLVSASVVLGLSHPNNLNFIIFSAFIGIFAFVLGNALQELSQEERNIQAGARLGILFTIVSITLLQFIAPDLNGIYVALGPSLYLFMMIFSAILSGDEDKERAPILKGFNWNNVLVFTLAIAMGGVLMISIFADIKQSLLLVIFTGFLYLYLMIFSTSGAANSFHISTDSSNRSIVMNQAIGLAVGTYYFAALLLAWFLGVSVSILVVMSLLSIYLFLVGETLVDFVPTENLDSDQIHYLSALIGLGLTILFIPFSIIINSIEIGTITLIGSMLFWLYMIIVGSATVESALIKQKSQSRFGMILGGFLGVGLAVATTFIYRVGLTTIFGLDSSSRLDLGHIVDITLSAVDEITTEFIPNILLAGVFFAVFLVLAYALTRILEIVLAAVIPEGNATKDPKRAFIFYKPTSFLMAPIDFVLAPIQNRMRSNDQMAYFFVLPNMTIFGIFILMPMILNFYIGFTDSKSFLPATRWLDSNEQLQTQNLEDILTCEDYGNPQSCEEDRFWRAARNTGFYVSVQVGTMVVLALITALALNQKIIMRGFFRSVFFYPVLLSPVVVAYIWIWILDTDSGLINGFLENYGYDRIRFLGNPKSSDWSKFWVIAVADWAFMGFYTLILLAGLQAIPNSLYEAAQIDGANAWHQFWRITLPLLMPTMTVVLVLSLIRAVQAFDQVFVLTGGGPGTATLYIVQYIYQSFKDRQEYGLASAASLLLAAVLFIATMAQLHFARRSEVA